MIKLALVAALFSTIFTIPLNPKKVVVAVNCGSSEGLVGSDGIKYSADVNFVDGDTREADYTTNSALENLDLKYTFDKDVYMHERHTYSRMTYTLPIREGFNTIILKFAEMYFGEKGKRVFDVLIGDTVVLKNFDVYADVGKFSASDKYLEVEVKNGNVYFNGQATKNGLSKKNIKITFAKGKADNPIIQGIVIYNAPIAQSNLNEYNLFKSKWSQQKQMLKAKKQQQQLKQLIAVQKKKEKIVIRNDELEIVDQQDVQKPTAGVASGKGGIRSLLTSPLGVLIWAVIIACGVVYLYNNVFLMNSELKIA